MCTPAPEIVIPILVDELLDIRLVTYRRQHGDRDAIKLELRVGARHKLKLRRPHDASFQDAHPACGLDSGFGDGIDALRVSHERYILVRGEVFGWLELW